MAGNSIAFWGVRGSLPAPSRYSLKYGGNTACIDVNAGKDRIILDAGTGIMLLGEKLKKKKGRMKVAILISHLHWDHIAGLPFFAPLYKKGNSFVVIGPRVQGGGFGKALMKAVSPPYFPMSLKKVPARVRFKNAAKRFKLGKVIITAFKLFHPGGAIGWRLAFPGGKSIVYVSDNEPGRNAAALIKWAMGSDIFIHDAQYTKEDYMRKRGWGHSPYLYPAYLAMRARTKMLILSHHEPLYSDKKLEGILSNVRRVIKKCGFKIRCELAREGAKYKL